MVTDLKPIIIKPMEKADAKIVLRIYENSIKNEDVTFETQLPSWEAWNKAHDPNCRLVACIDGKVVGFIVLSHVFTHPAYAGVAEISIYVDQNYRKQGIGYREKILKRKDVWRDVYVYERRSPLLW